MLARLLRSVNITFSGGKLRQEILLIKVVLTFAFNGIGRRAELCSLKVDEIQDNKTVLIVTLNNTKTKKRRSVQTALNANDKQGKSFLYYMDNKCTSQAVGINTIAEITQKMQGPLGFLSYGDEILPGNNGLKDQNLAIRWIKENIIYFGGNPNSITLFGQSAGAVSAHFHMLSPLSKDLIHGVIGESGHAFTNWAVALPNVGPMRSKRLAQYFNCPIYSSYEMIKCLQKVNVYEIMAAQNLFYVSNSKLYL
ncbi:hypothetical protein ILUMI_07227 [Ignelater luminosus]|uniref:Carboxylic ester hydrolase n=1 Tax=Ignelater luminosus TaxID=2038154 RepID=A0A8K0D3W5_IGNLU|nr:hypothetical protein ILUMI_07227 [Ignelater luminosus]